MSSSNTGIRSRRNAPRPDYSEDKYDTSLPTPSSSSAANNKRKHQHRQSPAPAANHGANVNTHHQSPSNSNSHTTASSTPAHSHNAKSFVVPATPSSASNAQGTPTFDNSEARLKNGKLEADDGSVYSPNGAPLTSISLFFSIQPISNLSCPRR